MPARRLGLVVVALGALAALGVGMARAGSQSTHVTLSQLQGVNFVSTCAFSHRAPDDPIVFPGHPGWSHDHSFVGNVSTDAFSTLASLHAAGTTCRRPGDTAAYWMPTLMLNGLTGSPVPPAGATVYYRRRSLTPVQPFPQGLRVIAGDSRATAPQSLRVVFWNCGVEGRVAPSSTPPSCPSGRQTALRLHVTFPSCWNGHDLDSADHKSHMAYPLAGVCPASHPVPVSQLTVIFRYPPVSGPVTLASGTALTGHADFFNAWDEDALAHLVAGCLNALRHCQQGS